MAKLSFSDRCGFCENIIVRELAKKKIDIYGTNSVWHKLYNQSASSQASYFFVRPQTFSRTQSIQNLGIPTSCFFYYFLIIIDQLSIEVFAICGFASECTNFSVILQVTVLGQIFLHLGG